jgi:hypothetical protein
VGLYADYLEQRLRQGPIVRGLCSLQFGWPTVGAADSFVLVSHLQSAESGAHWISPFGVPAARGLVPAASKSKLVARIGATLYPLQTDNHETSPYDGSMLFCAAHFKTPADYVAMTPIEIGYHNSEPQPAPPNWSTVTGGFTTPLNVTVSFCRPKILICYMRGTPLPGDELAITFADGLGSDQTYTQPIDHLPVAFIDVDLKNQVEWMMQKRITLDASGRFMCFKDNVAKFIPVTASNYTSGKIPWFGSGWIERALKVSGNAYVSQATGIRQGSPYTNPNIPLNYYNGESTGAFIVWSRPNSGNPPNFTGTFAVNRLGRTINYDTVVGAVPVGCKVLSYDARTVAFQVGEVAWGQTSGFNGLIVGITGSGSMGKLLLRYVDGTPQNDEIVKSAAAQDGVPTSWSGSATVDGTIAQNTITGSLSGFSADLLDSDGTKLYFKNATGAFVDNDVFTDLAGSGQCTANGTASGASTFAIATAAADTTGATSGTLPTLDSAVARSDVTATFNTGTNAPIMNPFFDGHSVYQLERICNVNSHIQLRLKVSWDSTGAVIDRQVDFENPHCRANADEYFYDVTSIDDGTTNFIASVLSDYKQIIHTPWQAFSWAQTKTFGMCDPYDFMSSKKVSAWKRFPSRDLTPMIKQKTQGLDSLVDLSQIENSTMLAFRGGYAKDKPGLPLFAGPIKFDGSGGADVEIGVQSGWEYAFWSSDTFLMWEQFSALCRNCWSAYPWYCRDEEATGDDADQPPHFYKRWKWLNYGSYYVSSDEKILWASNRNVDGTHGTNNTRNYSMWTGSLHHISYGMTRMPMFSHAPAHPGRTAYLVQPESVHRLRVRQYGWVHGTVAPNSQEISRSPPKTGGVANDANHVLGYASYGNGWRSWAWPWRSVMYCAADMPDRHPGKATAKKAAQDHANHFHQMASKTWNGLVHIRGARHSDNWQTVPSMQSGEPLYRGGDAEALATTGDTVHTDAFRGGYCHQVAIQSHDLEITDCSAALEFAEAYLRSVEDLGAEWWAFCQLYYPALSQSVALDTYTATASPVIWPTKSFTHMNDWIEQFSPANYYAASRMYEYQTTPQKEVNIFGQQSYGVLYVPNYSVYAFQKEIIHGIARNAASSTMRNRATAVADFLDTKFPYEEIDDENRSGFGMSVANYEYIWGAHGVRRPELLATYNTRLAA